MVSTEVTPLYGQLTLVSSLASLIQTLSSFSVNLWLQMCEGYLLLLWFPKQIYLHGVLTFCLRTRWVLTPTVARCADQLLCAGCGLGDTCCRLVYAKWSLTPLWLKNRMVLTHYASQTPLGAKSLFLAKISICSEGGVPSVSSLFKYI